MMDTFTCSICAMCRYRHQVVAVPKFEHQNPEWHEALGAEIYARVGREKHPVACLEHFEDGKPRKLADGEAHLINVYFHDHGYSRLSRGWSETVGPESPAAHLFCSICGKEVPRSSISKHSVEHCRTQNRVDIGPCIVHTYLLEEAIKKQKSIERKQLKAKDVFENCPDCVEHRRFQLKSELEKQIRYCFGIDQKVTINTAVVETMENLVKETNLLKNRNNNVRAPSKKQLQKKRKPIKGWFFSKNSIRYTHSQKFSIPDGNSRKFEELARIEGQSMTKLSLEVEKSRIFGNKNTSKSIPEAQKVIKIERNEEESKDVRKLPKLNHDIMRFYCHDHSYYRKNKIKKEVDF